jgi:hypothetical protein
VGIALKSQHGIWRVVSKAVLLHLKNCFGRIFACQSGGQIAIVREDASVPSFLRAPCRSRPCTRSPTPEPELCPAGASVRGALEAVRR